MTKHITKHLTKHLVLALVLAFPLLAVGCDGGDDDVGTDDFLDIAGTYEDQFLTTHVINEMEWTQSGDMFSATYTVTQWDNDVGYVIAQNAADDAFNPDLFSRFDWVYVGEDLYYCQTTFNAETEQAAIDTARADDGDPAMGGCGGMFPWTLLTP